MRKIIWVMMAIVTLGTISATETMARDANPIVRSEVTIAGTVYASALLDGDPMATGSTAIRNEQLIDLFLFASRGTKTDQLYAVTISSHRGHSAFRGMDDTVPFAVARQLLVAEGELGTKIDDVIGARVISFLGSGKIEAKTKNDPRVARVCKILEVRASQIIQANRPGINHLSAKINKLNDWPWGFPQGKDKQALRNAIADGFKEFPPVMPSKK